MRFEPTIADFLDDVVVMVEGHGIETPPVIRQAFGECIDSYCFDDEIKGVLLVNPKVSIELVGRFLACGFETAELAVATERIIQDGLKLNLLSYAFPEPRRTETGIKSAVFVAVGRRAEVDTVRIPPLYIAQMTGNKL